MSVEVLQNFSPAPMRSACETISLASDGSSKCAEIFVTNNADKWTFFCAYCQMATVDIGAFICHIRLEHLNRQTSETQSKNSTTIAASLANDGNVTGVVATTRNKEAEDEFIADAQQQATQNEIIIKQEVTMASNQENLQSFGSENENLIANKNYNATLQYPAAEMNEEAFITMTPIQWSNIPHELYFEPYHEEYNQDWNEAAEINEYNSNSTQIETEKERDSDANKVGCSETNIMISTVPIYPDFSTLINECQHCHLVFKTRKCLMEHLISNHNNLQLKCGKCHRVFPTASGLNLHLRFHRKNRIKAYNKEEKLQCPVCPSRHKIKYLFTHILTHQSDTCFPCQVCFKVYSTNDARMQHWETHATDKPFYCKICYRRFFKKLHLLMHLKTHN